MAELDLADIVCYGRKLTFFKLKRVADIVVV